MIAVFMTAIPLAGVVSGAVSGWILSTMANFGSLRGWQLLFLCEGLPSAAAGLVTMRLLKNGPEEASWLSRKQKDLIAKNLCAEEELKTNGERRPHRFQDAFRSPAVWLLSLVFFGFAMANYGISYWMPQMISDTVTRDPLMIGLLSMIPWGVGAISMVLMGRHSDATGERRWHIAIAATVGGVTFAVSAIPGLPAAGIAIINSVGNLSGYLSPFMAGRIRDATHSMAFALLMFSGSCVVAALIVAMLKLRGKQPLEGSEA